MTESCIIVIIVIVVIATTDWTPFVSGTLRHITTATTANKNGRSCVFGPVCGESSLITHRTCEQTLLLGPLTDEETGALRGSVTCARCSSSSKTRFCLAAESVVCVRPPLPPGSRNKAEGRAASPSWALCPWSLSCSGPHWPHYDRGGRPLLAMSWLCRATFPQRRDPISCTWDARVGGR